MKKHFCTQLWFVGESEMWSDKQHSVGEPCRCMGSKYTKIYIDLSQESTTPHLQGVFLALPFHPNFSAKKNVVQPTRIFCTSEISWNRICLFVCLWFVAGCQDCCFKACDPFGSPFLWTVRETLLVTSDNNTAPPLTETALDAWQQTSREDNQASARKTRIR